MTDPFVGESEWGRCFVFGWTSRREGVLRLAARLKAMALALEDFQPGFGRLWPQFEARSLRPDDPGFLLDCPVEDLARLLDRRARSGPPRLPAPVGPEGYRVALAGLPDDGLGSLHGANIWVDCECFDIDEPVHMSTSYDSPIWRNAEMAQRLLLALVDVWDAEWAIVGTSINLGLDGRGALISEEKPWMSWVASGHRVPDYQVEDAGAPLDVQAVRGGVISTWTWPPNIPEPPEPGRSA